jgi:hypothetical protein
MEREPKAKEPFVRELVKHLKGREPRLARLVEEGLGRGDAAILYAVANAHLAFVYSMGNLDWAVEALKLVLREEGYEV